MEIREKTIKPENQGRSFEEQFANRERLEILGGEIEIVDIKPANLKEETPVLFAPGWGGTFETFKDAISVMAGQNRRVISLSHLREEGEVKSTENYPAAELRKALTLNQLLDKKGIDKVDVVAHSEGAINVAIAASLHPEKIRSIVFVDPAGIMGEDKFPKLVRRFSMKFIKDAMRAALDKEARRPLVRSGLEAMKYAGKNPKMALEEAVAISKTDILSMIHDLHEKGIGIAVMHGVDDDVFPMADVQKNAEDHKLGDFIDGFYSVKGTHDEVYIHPEKYVKFAVEHALEALAKKHGVK